VASGVASDVSLGSRLRAGSRGLRANRWSLLAVPPLLFLGVLFAYPLAAILARSFTDPSTGVANYQHFFESGVYVRTLITTLKTSALVAVICLLIGYPYAYLMAHVGPAWRKLLIFLVLVPFWTSLLVRTYAWTVLLQDSGLVNRALIRIGLIDEPISLIRTTTGVVIGMSHILLPFVVLPLYANMRTIDPALMRAAANLGASGASAFRRVYLPLTRPGIAAGFLIVFIYALGFYITPALLGSPQNAMLSELIVLQVSQLFNWGLAATMAAVLLAATLLLLGILSRFLRSDVVYRSPS
jgi:putative spermidine/putrescine transport system permease protein